MDTLMKFENKGPDGKLDELHDTNALVQDCSISMLNSSFFRYRLSNLILAFETSLKHISAHIVVVLLCMRI